MSEVHSEADISRIADPAALVSTRPSLAPSQWHRMAMRAAPQSGRRGIYAAFMKTSSLYSRIYMGRCACWWCEESPDYHGNLSHKRNWRAPWLLEDYLKNR